MIQRKKLTCSQQRLPVCPPRSDHERAGYHEHLGPCRPQPRVQLWETEVVACAQPDTSERRALDEQQRVAGFGRCTFQEGAVLDTDVEKMGLSVLGDNGTRVGDEDVGVGNPFMAIPPLMPSPEREPDFMPDCQLAVPEKQFRRQWRRERLRLRHRRADPFEALWPEETSLQQDEYANILQMNGHGACNRYQLILKDAEKETQPQQGDFAK